MTTEDDFSFISLLTANDKKEVLHPSHRYYSSINFTSTINI